MDVRDNRNEATLFAKFGNDVLQVGSVFNGGGGDAETKLITRARDPPGR